jgi:hypothetical protein
MVEMSGIKRGREEKRERERGRERGAQKQGEIIFFFITVAEGFQSRSVLFVVVVYCPLFLSDKLQTLSFSLSYFWNKKNTAVLHLNFETNLLRDRPMYVKL